MSVMDVCCSQVISTEELWSDKSPQKDLSPSFVLMQKGNIIINK